MAAKLILIVEDDGDARFILQALLSHAGYRVIEAGNGVDAVASALRDRPELILMDIRMPLMDGLSAAHAIHEVPEIAGTPMLAISADPFGPDEREAFERLFQGVFPKPVDSARLLAALRYLIGPGDESPPPAGPGGAAAPIG